MYKCSECGTEYDVKPEYCDCGNDTFEQIVVKPTAINEKPHPEPVKKQENIKDIPKLKPVPKPELSSEPSKIKYESNYDYSRLKAFFDPISTVAFLLCIALSIVVAFWGEDKNENIAPVSQSNSKSEEIIANIPSIDSYWDNTAPIKKVVQVEPEESATQEEPNIVQLVEQVFKPQKVEQPKPQIVTPKVVTSATPKVPVQTKNVATPAPKAQSSKTPKPTAVTSQTKTNVPSQSVTDLTNRVKNSIQYTNQTAPKTVSTATTTAKSSTPATTAAKVQTQTTKIPAIRTNTSTTVTSSNAVQTQYKSQSQTAVPVVKTVDPAVAKQELANYKASLRNAIGRKIDFTRVVGDGDCALSFKVNSSGKLTNRAFTKQSSNVTLNNAVYAAMNSTTSFSAPPSAYNNETLNLKIRFYNGNFEIYLN